MLIVVLIVAAAASAWLLWRTSPFPAQSDPRDEAMHPARDAAAEPAAAKLGGAPGLEPQPEIAQSRSTAEFDAHVRVLLDGVGSQPAQPFPSRVVVRSELDSSTKVLDAEHGFWEGRLPLGGHQVVAVSGEECVPLLLEHPRIAADAPVVEVHVSLPDHWLLSVVDRATQQPLDGFTLHTVDAASARSPSVSQTFSRNEHSLPGALESLVAGARSPCSVPESRSRGYFWVCAPGFAPAAFMRNSFQRERTVQLDRCGSVEVSYAKTFWPYAAQLSARLGGERVSWRFSLKRDLDRAPLRSCALEPASEHMLVECAPCGRYVAAVDLLDGNRPMGSVFRAELEVNAEQTTRLTIAPPESSARPDFCALRVTVVLPPWSRGERESLRLMRLDGAKPTAVRELRLANSEATPGLPSERHARFDLLEPGRYRVRLMPCGKDAEVDVGAGLTEARIEGTQECTVEVRLASSGGEPVSPCVVYWSYAGDGAPERTSIAIDPDTNAGELLCSTRKIRLQAVGPDTCSMVQEFDPQPGRANRVTLDVLQETLTIVRMTSWASGGHSDVDYNLWNKLRFEPVGGTGALLSVHYGVHGTSAQYGPAVSEPDWAQAVFVLSAPGTYLLHVPGQDRPREIRVQSGMNDVALGL